MPRQHDLPFQRFETIAQLRQGRARSARRHVDLMDGDLLFDNVEQFARATHQFRDLQLGLKCPNCHLIVHSVLDSLSPRRAGFGHLNCR